MWRYLASLLVVLLVVGAGLVLDTVTSDGGVILLAMFVIGGVGFAVLWPVQAGFRERPRD